MGEYWLCELFRLIQPGGEKEKLSSLALCEGSTGRRYLYGIFSPGWYQIEDERSEGSFVLAELVEEDVFVEELLPRENVFLSRSPKPIVIVDLCL
jgi:hypothetical protein